MPTSRPLSPSSTSRPRTTAQWARQAQGARSTDAFLTALRQGEVNVASRDASGQTLLHHLAQAGRQDVFDAVLNQVMDRQPSLIEARTKTSGITPLQMAAAAGNLHAVQKLLAAGAQINQSSLYNGTALHAAAEGWHATVVDALLNAGADVNGTERSVTPLNRTFYPSTTRTNDTHALLATVDRLLAAGATPATDDGFAMPTMLRAIGYPALAVERLLAAGGDPNQRDLHGKTPLMELVAPTSSPSSEQEEANALAAFPLLIAAGADLNAVDGKGNTALLLAVSRVRLDLVTQLLTAGADPHAVNEEGNNALHLAADFPSEDMVTLLMNAGVSTTAVNRAQQTPLARARSHTFGSDAVIARLEEAELRQAMRTTRSSIESLARERARL